MVCQDILTNPGAAFVRGWLLLGIALCPLCLGCGGEDWQAETWPARGSITINGEPPVGAYVQLHPTGEATDVRDSRPWALVKEDGTFTLTTYEAGDGAPAGEYAVTVRWSPDVNSPSMADRLNNAYSNPDQSEWKVSIVEGENVLPPIVIEGATVLDSDKASKSKKLPPGPEMGN